MADTLTGGAQVTPAPEAAPTPAAPTPQAPAPTPAPGSQAPAPTTGQPAAPAPAGTIAGGNPAEPAQPAPASYDFSKSVPEGWKMDEAAAGQFSTIANGLKLNNEQANQLAKYGMEYAAGAVKAYQAQQEAQAKSWAEATKTALGADYDKTVGLVGTAVERMEKVIPNLRQVLNEGGIGNRVEVVKLFAEIGKMVGEDGGHSLKGAAANADAYAARYPKTDFSRYK